jgi:hypothetical protein
MDFFEEGEVSLICFEGGLSCKKRLFFGEIVLTNYRLITVSTSIQKNPGSDSEIWKHHLNILSFVSLKRDSFLAKLNKQKLAEGILHLAFSGLIFISRFKNLFDAVMNYAKKHNGLLDEFADLSGILFGYTPVEVADYCSEERLKKFNLIK